MTQSDNWSEERRKRYSELMRERNFGKPKSAAQREKMSAAKKGKTQSPEHIAKRTQSMIATKHANRKEKQSK